MVLDRDLNVVCTEPRALEYLARAYPGHADNGALPEPLSSAIRVRLRTLDADSLNAPPDEGLVLTAETLTMRIVPLHGAKDYYLTLLLEPQARREHLRRAVDRYALTKREAQVLTYLMQGAGPSDIANALTISQATVKDHVKSLLKKTDARSRAEMLTKVYGRE